jgi:hypothetical protein
MQALLELDCIPAGMELFPASDDDQWTLIKRVIDDCDYYLVILAGRYGSLDAGGVGYTEKEYDYAIQARKPAIAFVHKDPGSIPQKHTDVDPELRAKLDLFRAKVERKTVRYWGNAAELGTAVTTSYVRLIKSHPAEGWVKARYARTQEDADKTAQLLEQVRELEKEIAALRALGAHDTSTLAQGTDPVSLTFRYRANDGELQQQYETDWDSIFGRIGMACIDRPSEGTVRGRLAAWLYEQTGSRFDQLDVTEAAFAKIKLQLFSLGLIEICRESVERTGWQPAGPSTRIQHVWTLTERGRIALANLVGQKRPG